MNNQQTTQQADNGLPIAIVHNTSTLSITFVEKPSDEQRRQLREAGYRYENGKWFKSQSQGYHADESLVAQVLAA